MAKTCVIYVRKSDKNQDDITLEHQEQMCRKYAQEKGYIVLEVFKDDSKSGRYLKGRDAFMEALAFTEENHVDYFLVTETDRFARSKKDHIWAKEFLKNHGSRLIGVNQSFTEEDTPEADLMDGIVSSMNEFYSRLYGAKTKRAMLKKLEKGEWPGKAPDGYKNVNIGTEDNQHNVIQKDEATSPLWLETFSLLATGQYNCRTLNDLMYSKGLRARSGKKLAQSSFIHKINNPFYYGMMEWDNPHPHGTKEWKEALYKGSHEPLIDEPMWDACQAAVAKINKYANRERKHSERFYLRPVMRCGICGCPLTAEVHPKKNVAYYHCTLKSTKKKHNNIGQNVRADVLEELIANQFRKIQFTAPLMQKIIARASEILDETHNVVDTQRRGLQNRVMKLENRKSALEDDRLDRVIDPETYKRKKAEIEAEIILFENQIMNLKVERDSNIDVFDRLMVLTDDLHDTYTNAQPHLKRHLVGLFFKTISLRDRQISNIEYTDIIATLLENRAVIITDEWLPR